MSKFHDRAEAQTKQIIGQMLGDEMLVQEGEKEYRKPPTRRNPTVVMSRASCATNADRSSPRQGGSRPAREQGGPRRRPARTKPWQSASTG